MKTLRIVSIQLLMLLPMMVFAQTHCVSPEMQDCVRKYNDKINELIDKHSHNGFHILKEQKLPMRSATDMVVSMPLYEGDWYHFCFVGDPSADKIKASLYLEGFGDIIQDRIIVKREHEFWTEFSFMCPQTGNYELTLFQKSEVNRPLSYLTVFKKDATTQARINTP
jgi:hypothetical protein